MPTGPLSDAEIERLRRVDTPTVCNAIELFDVRPRNTGYMDRRITCCMPKLKPMVGYAATATFRSHAPPRGSDVYASLDAQIASFKEIPPPPVVVFQDLDDPPAAATFGEVMCTTYRAFGAAGLITSGAGRDLDQVESLEFPVFVGGVICSHGYCHILQTNIPVHVGGLTVYPGDLLHGDRNGVTTIPVEIAKEVVRVCEEFVELETEILTYLKSAGPTVEGFADHRRRMADRVKEITKRVQSRS